MEEINQLITGLETKIKTLIIKQNAILTKNSELSKENKTLQTLIDEQNKKITALEEQNKQTSNQTLAITDTTNMMKGRINDIVKEIDLCIEQLS